MATNIPTKQVWHALTIDEAIAALDTNPNLGLDASQVGDLQTLYERSELNVKALRSKLSIFVDQC